MQKPKRAPAIKIDKGASLEDMPWCGSAQVVSERLKVLLETHAPSHAQFVQVLSRGTKKSEELGSYYLVNWLRLIDCIDFEKTERERLEEETESRPAEYHFNGVVIRASAVPKKVVVFRMKYFQTPVVMDAHLVEIIKKGGFTGPQFYRIDDTVADVM